MKDRYIYVHAYMHMYECMDVYIFSVKDVCLQLCSETIQL